MCEFAVYLQLILLWYCSITLRSSMHVLCTEWNTWREAREATFITFDSFRPRGKFGLGPFLTSSLASRSASEATTCSSSFFPVTLIRVCLVFQYFCWNLLTTEDSWLWRKWSKWEIPLQRHDKPIKKASSVNV